MQRAGPFRQRGEGRGGIVGIDLQLLQASEMAVPAFDQALTLPFDLGVRLRAAPSGRFGLKLAFVLDSTVPRLFRLGQRQFGLAPTQQGNLLAPAGNQTAQVQTGAVESRLRQRGHGGWVVCSERAFGVSAADPCRIGVGPAFPAQVDQQAFGQLHALRRTAGFVDADLQAPVCLFDRPGGLVHRMTAGHRLPLGAFEAVGVLHRRVRAQRIQHCAAACERDLGFGVSGLGQHLPGLHFLEPSLGFAARAACIVELGLCLAQTACLPPALRAGIDPVALLEAIDGLGQHLIFFQLAMIFLQLAQRLGYVAEQLGRERRQRLGQRIRQGGLIGLPRQLRLAQLNEGIHQRVVAFAAQVKQPLVDGAAVVGRGIEYLAPAIERFAQALLGQDDALGARQPQILIDARSAFGIFQHEEPAVHMGTRSGGREAGTERKIAWRAVVGDASELDPGITDAPVVAVHQQVPGHLLAAVAIRLDAR